MPPSSVYREIRHLLNAHLDPQVKASTVDRIALLVLGLMTAQSASPARIAKALGALGLSGAKAESIERRVRRIENDGGLTATLCLHPLARAALCWGSPRELVLILDATTQQEHLVKLQAAVWYRGRALPLAWVLWEANTPLDEGFFWPQVEALLEVVAGLLPAQVPVTWLADRAFGTPAFTDRVTARGWHYVVRLQHQTRYRDRRGIEQSVGEWIPRPGQRAKGRGQLFKKRGWREASLIVHWGRHQASPLCLASDHPPRWAWLALYRRRYAIEASFRDDKSYGWHWEQGQVRDLLHGQRLLVAMALSSWLAMMLGTQVAAEWLAQPATGRRVSRPWAAKQSLFQLGLERLQAGLYGSWSGPYRWQLSDWEAANWAEQIHQHHAYAFVFPLRQPPKILKVQFNPVRP
jgi:hypothetical protein